MKWQLAPTIFLNIFLNYFSQQTFLSSSGVSDFLENPVASHNPRLLSYVTFTIQTYEDEVQPGTTLQGWKPFVRSVPVPTPDIFVCCSLLLLNISNVESVYYEL